MIKISDYKRYEVFVSSTYKDLQKERSIVMKAILDMGHFPSGMEEFPATDQEQFEYIKKVMDTADYYILIMGGSCGSIADEKKGFSYTWMEYNYAVEREIPIIVFVKTDATGEPVIDRCDQKRERVYENFLEIVQKNRIRRSFHIAEELAGLVLHSLSEEIKTHPRHGWIRDYKPDYICDKLLLRGRLYYYICIDRSIYDSESISETIILPYFELIIWCDRGSQGVFVIACSCEGEGHNFYYDIPEDKVDCFDDEGLLKDNYCVQLSLAKMGNKDEVLLFISVGDGQSDMITKVFRVDRFQYKNIGTVSGQSHMIVDYSLSVPYGEQGLYESYVYHDGEIMKVEPLEGVTTA